MLQDSFPQYLRIAVNMASRIADGEYEAGERLPGLSKISSEFNVSPETVRKAVKLLEDMKIVEARERSGVTALSPKNARMYLESVNFRREQYDLREQMQSLLTEYQKIGREIAEISDKLLAASMQPLPSEQTVPTFEVVVSADSDKIGRSIGSVKYWQATGCTIVAIRRGQNLIVAPGPYELFMENDVVVCAGRGENAKIARLYLNTSTLPDTLPADDYHEFWAANINQDIVEEQSRIQQNICAFLQCRPEDVTRVAPMQQGLNNHSFSFFCRGEKYVYRHPGINAVNVIDREKEAFALNTAKRLGIDDTLLYIDSASGWKISRFVEATEAFDFFNRQHVARLADHLRVLNESNTRLGFAFDYEQEANRLFTIIRELNPRKYRGLLPVRERMQPAFAALRDDPWQVSMCHNDLYEPNLLLEGERLHIIDWEFAGDSDIGFDICKIFAVVMPTYEEIDGWLRLYYDAPPTAKQKRHLIANAAIIYYYWYVWALYADENGENIAEYLPEWKKKMEYYIHMLEERKEA